MLTVYKVKSGHVAGWGNTIKGDKLEYWQDGRGWKQTKVFEAVAEIEYAETWREVIEINRTYGLTVALASAEYMTAGVLKWAYTMAYIDIARKLTEAGFSMDVFEKCIAICRVDYWLALCGTGSFDVIKLDERIRTPDGVSIADHLTNIYGKEVSDAIRAGI
jgi:hypothetical protein